jgi:acyl-CoA reductase-like NAD-dependent aldehyde dehydrogenase
MVDEARTAGATLALGGSVPDGEGAFYPPSVLTDVADGPIAREEVFGPVAVIQRAAGEAEAVASANDSRYGLVATVWTRDAARGPRVARALQAGTVAVNTPYTNFPGVPYGGWKESGIGREGGLEAVDSYLETKSVALWSGARPSRPPWPQRRR